MEFLTANTKSLLASNLADGRYISAKDKHVVVIGGGDTGADCIGTALRHGCKSLVNLELLDQSPAKRAADNPWPLWPKIHRSDYAHEEADRALRCRSAQLRRRVEGIRGQRRQGRRDPHQPRRVAAGRTARRRWSTSRARRELLEADLVLLAMGFLGPEAYLAQALGRGARPALELPRRARQVRDERARRVRRRRLPPRPIARRLGHQRRPRRRARRRRVPDGREPAAGAEAELGGTTA